MLSVESGNKLWGPASYGRVYEHVTTFIPYRSHIQRLIDMLELCETSFLIDLGCGTGYLLSSAKKNFGCSVVGIDVSSALLSVAHKKLGQGAQLKCCDLTFPIPFEDSSFDRIVSNNVLGFLKDPVIFWNEISRILKPNGIFVVSTMLPGFKQTAVYFDHLKKAGYWEAVRSIMPTLMVGYFNYKITRSIGSKSYAGYVGYDRQSIEKTLSGMPFYKVIYDHSYANQNIVVKGFRQ